MNHTIHIRSNDQQFLFLRQRDLESKGFTTSLVTMEADPVYDVWMFDLYVDFDQAHLLERVDDRWQVANAFFSQAEIQEGRKNGTYARLSNDWASFGYRKHSLASYLELEHQEQAVAR